MATFSTNQVRQLYIVKYEPDENALVDAGDAAGTISYIKNDDAKQLLFSYMSVGGITRSDLIDLDKITSCTYKRAADLVFKPKQWAVTLSSEALGSSGNLIPHQEYILRVAFRNYVGISEEDQYFKYGMVKAESVTTPSEFYAKMAISLVKSLSATENSLYRVGVVTASGLTEVTKATTLETLAPATNTYTKIVLTAGDPEWVLGTMQQEFANFTPQPMTITVDGDEILWGSAANDATVYTAFSGYGNGKAIADLEYFCMGERGDIYRNVGFPHSIKTQYLADPTETYNVLDIHYYSTGSGINSQKSEKTITIASIASVDLSDIYSAVSADL